MRRIILFFFFLIFIGCGYKPSSYYRDKVMGDDVAPSIKISIKDPQTSIFVKDALRSAIFSVFGKNISEDAKTKIDITSISANLSSIDYDPNGLIKLYRAKVSLKVLFIDKLGKKHSFSVSGTYDFSVTNNSVVDDQLKLNAYKSAAVNALDMLYAKITEIGVSYDNKGDS